jgi:hypothetical protein
MRSVQLWLVNRYLAGLEEKYDGRMSIGGVLIRWPHRIEVTDLLVLDPLNDTLFYSSMVSLSVNHLDLDENKLSLGRTLIQDPTIRFRQLPSGQMNYDLFLNSLSSGDSSSVSRPFSLSVNRLTLRRGLFQFRKFGSVQKPGQVNWDNLLIDDIEVSIKDLAFEGREVEAAIEVFSFREQSGFSLNEFSAGVRLDSSGIEAQDLILMTGHSLVESGRARVEGLWSPFETGKKLLLDLEVGVNTYLSPDDLALLSGIHTGLNTPLEVSGYYYGSPG